MLKKVKMNLFWSRAYISNRRMHLSQSCTWRAVLHVLNYSFHPSNETIFFLICLFSDGDSKPVATGLSHFFFTRVAKAMLLDAKRAVCTAHGAFGPYPGDEQFYWSITCIGYMASWLAGYITSSVDIMAYIVLLVADVYFFLHLFVFSLKTN